MTHYDVIVIGAGGVGSAALYHGAAQGLKILGIDRFSPPHNHGSSHGQTRIIRMAYFEHPDYVPLLKQAYAGWKHLEQLSGQQLYHEVGLLEVGPVDGIVIPGVLRSSKEHDLPLDQFTTHEAQRQFPGFDFPENHTVLFEQQAGYLMVEDCIASYLAAAQQQGAKLNCEESLVSWKPHQGEVEVVTDKQTYRCSKLIITTGAWTSSFTGNCQLPLTLLRKHLYWYRSDSKNYLASQGCPVFFYEDQGRFFYGFPELQPGTGVKVSEHSGGDPLSDPSVLDPSQNQEDRLAVEAFLKKSLPQVSRDLVQHAACMYTMTPDENFIVDVHPECADVVLAAGLSGHGFKFASVLGQMLIELSATGNTSLPIDFLSIKRFG
ncbi:MAG: N-methyl-L-tryptophan oxidase [Blastopirellula sp.]|nr:MAG: N-methyl-L-tryptophan oxidase [Blastopirellula sp.]